MIKLITRYDNDLLQVCCIGEHGEHLWVTIYDLYDYMTEEVLKAQGKMNKKAIGLKDEH